MRTARHFGFGLALVFVVAAAHAEPSAADQKMGRELFERGVKAAKVEDWAAAERYFNQAYGVLPRPTILGSLAGAQAKAGHVTQAVASYRRLLQDPGDLSPDELSAFKSGAAAAEARLAWVRVDVMTPRADDSVLLDDGRVGPESLSGEIPADPGAHSLKLVRDKATTTVNVTLADGEHRKVTLMPILAPPPYSSAPAPPVSEKRSLFASPWFWAITGVVVAAGVGFAVLCATSVCKRDEGVEGNLGRIDLR